MKVSIYGDTHYAWVTAAKLAETGNQVVLRIDVGDAANQAPNRVTREAMLAELLGQQQASGRLMLDNAEMAYSHGSTHLLAADASLAAIEQVVDRILEHAEGDCYLVVLSPLPVGALRELQDYAFARLRTLAKPYRVYVATLPLFIREGTALADFARPSLFVLGAEHEVVVKRVLDLMRPFVRNAAHMMVVPLAAAELIKFGINAMLATRISFMNEMAALSERLGVDVEQVRRGLAADPRIGADYLMPGCGFGGPSFSDELLSFAQAVKENLDTGGLVDAVIAINESQREILFRKIWRFFRGNLQGRMVAIWGAAFKPGTASIENSSVLPLLQALWAQGCTTCVYDPLAGEMLRQQFPDQPLLEVAHSAADAVRGADALAIVTAWDEFWNPDFSMLRQLLKRPVIFDGRNIYEPKQMMEHGFRYFAIGRGESI
jgi:UDPglucose 6-dehydrogenase